MNYIRTLNIDEPLARIEANGRVRYYQADALGSVIALTDENGAVKTTYSYDPFGNVTVTGEASDNPFQYTGRENDNTGLYYYRARYYSPELQRFISEDPIGLKGGINFYAYVGNNPIDRIDPLGLTCAKGNGCVDCCNNQLTEDQKICSMKGLIKGSCEWAVCMEKARQDQLTCVTNCL